MSAQAYDHRILAVDDDPAILELIVTRLSLAGYQTFYARDGQEALRRLAEVRPAGLVLDINMPGLDGFGVLEHLAKTGARLPTLVLTARNQGDDVQRAIQLGARDFLAKPFEDKQLLARVARLVRRPAVKEAAPPLAGYRRNTALL
jgi:two-component system OmpR family response regulator